MKIELGKQIKKYRLEAKLSQEELADKVYVSRQTISNWENDKNYPDIKSLVLISDIFHISLDNLIKGDLERMKKEIIAFTEGKSLNEIEKAREEGKRPYQKCLLAAASALLTITIALIMTAIIKRLL